jgi:hypothetical protein
LVSFLNNKNKQQNKKKFRVLEGTAMYKFEKWKKIIGKDKLKKNLYLTRKRQGKEKDLSKSYSLKKVLIYITSCWIVLITNCYLPYLQYEISSESQLAIASRKRLCQYGEKKIVLIFYSDMHWNKNVKKKRHLDLIYLS